MRYAVLGSRFVLGLIFTVFGLNYFIGFLPNPELTGAAAEFWAGLGASGYFFAFLKVSEIAVGVLLLAGILVPLALTILAPISLNILFFHLFLEPTGLPIAIVVVGLNVFLAWAYRGAYRGVLDVKAQPSVG